MVPVRIGSHPDVAARPDGRQHRRLGENLRIGTDRDLQILRPQPFADQRFLQRGGGVGAGHDRADRSEEHTSELQSLMRISYAVFYLTKNKSSPATTPVEHRLGTTKRN